jgi:hypothetical protein
MANIKRKSKESGVALLLAIFALMLLSAIGLAMLCSADLETKIAANYRDKQSSIYAALSGLQQVRDELIPSNCEPTNCPATAINTLSLGLPSTSAQNVIYIVADNTVAPWDPANKYFDSELCSNFYYTLLPNFCTSGVPPSNNLWYHAIYNDSYHGAYQPGSAALPSALPFKWVRITLKADNMTPVVAQSMPVGNQMCWDGLHQFPVTATSGFDTSCKTAGGIVLLNGATTCTTCTFNPPLGSGYSNNPTVAISSPPAGGTVATATAHITTVSNGQVNSIAVTNAGSGYTTAPTVILTGGGGAGATATATIQVAGAPVASYSAVTQKSPVGCYSSSTPSASVSGGGGSGATAAVTTTGLTCIVGWTVGLSANCTAQKGNTFAVGATGGGGSGFAGSVTINSSGHGVGSYSITNPGSGYSSSPTAISTSSGCSLTATWTRGYQVASVALGSGGGGSGYTSAPAVSIAAPTVPAGESAPTVTAILGSQPANVGQVIGVTVTNAGSGYITAPTVAFSGGGGTGAAATASTGTTGKIDQIKLTNAGSGYKANPTVTITDSTGTGASIQAKANGLTIDGKVYLLTALAVTQGGSRTMAQMEVATPVGHPVTMPGALVIDSPLPNINPSNSMNYLIDGHDYNNNGAGCGDPVVPTKPSIGVFDNPANPTTPTAVACLTSELGGASNASCPQIGGVKSANYTGLKPSPDVENVYGALGDLTTPAGADELATEIVANATYTYGNNPGSIHLGSYPNDCPTIVVNGDLTLGPVSGCGVLLVTGNLTMMGNYSWTGPVFVIGAGGSFTGGGGGNGIIDGSLFVAQTKNADGTMRSVLGTPAVSFNISGGGGNGIRYDHCMSDDMLSFLGNPATSTQALKVLSLRTVY